MNTSSGSGAPKTTLTRLRRVALGRLTRSVRRVWERVAFAKLTGLLESMHSIEGWLTDSEALALYRLARTLRAGALAVEIGSWHGKSSIMIAAGLRDCGGGVLYAIDPFEGAGGFSARRKVQETQSSFLENFRQNLEKAGLGRFVQPVPGYSYEVVKHWADSVDFLFIDGDHEYDSVKLDFELWSPLLKPGGMIAFHDSNGNWPGPTRVVAEELRTPVWENIRCIDSLTFARKRASAPDAMPKTELDRKSPYASRLPQ